MRKNFMFRNFIIVFICIAYLSGCGSSTDNDASSDTNENKMSVPQSEMEQKVSVISTEEGKVTGADEEIQFMKITLDEKNYEVSLDNNETVKDIVNHLPLDLSIERYAGHEYYAELPYTPVFDENRISDIKAGHVYYWDGWNAFVINYIDWDITPYKVVHIGEITDKSIVDVLMNSDENISIQVTK